MSTKKLMMYGAAGYTGGMAAQHAAAAGLPLVLAGHSRSRAALEPLATRLDAELRLFDLEDAAAVMRHLEGIGVLLNCAGPFRNTAGPLMSAAIVAGVHYLDFSAELDTYQQALAMDQQAHAAGIMLLPGSGGSVAMLGSLAGHAVARLDAPRKISIALDVAGAMSKGSIRSAGQALEMPPLQRLDGELVARSADEGRMFDFGSGPRFSFPATLPDLLTLHHATGVPDIETFVHIAVGDSLTSEAVEGTAGPSDEARACSRYHAAVEVTGADGIVARSWLDTVNGYTFTAMAAAEAARRVLAGEVRPGFQTPAALFGNGFAGTIADTRIIDMALDRARAMPPGLETP